MRNLSSPLDRPGAGAARPLRGNSFVPQGYPDPGMLFVGHAENFSDARNLFVLRGKTVYERI